MKTCILISGAPSSGKDEITKYISKWYGFSKYSLADPVRKIVTIAFNLESMYYFNDRKVKEKKIKWGFSPREMCQMIGDGLRKVVNEEIWCNNLLERSGTDKNIVISDNRYQNEIDFLSKHFKVVTINIKRPGYDGKKIGIKNHDSETGLTGANFDYIIDNSKNLDHLKKSVDRIMDWLGIVKKEC